MNNDQQLEHLSNTIQNYKVSKAPPIFELFASLVAMSISILLFTLAGVFQQEATFYILMRTVMPQIGWATAFLVVGFSSGLGMILDKKTIRIVSLAALLILFGIVAVFYLITFPNLAGILMFWISIFTGLSIPLVRYTGLRK